jgi:hypothetical protein
VRQGFRRAADQPTRAWPWILEGIWWRIYSVSASFYAAKVAFDRQIGTKAMQSLAALILISVSGIAILYALYRMARGFGPLSVLNDAISSVPGVKYALGIAGIAAAVAIAKTFVTDVRVAFFCVIVIFDLMMVVLVLAKLTEIRPVLFTLLWFSVVMLITVGSLLFSSVFFRWPVDVQFWLLADDPKLRSINESVQAMHWGTIAFNAPNSMNIGDTKGIQLLLGSKTPGELESMIEEEGETEGHAVRVSDRMVATLTGTEFEIKNITPERQAPAVGGQEVTQWKWDIKALKAGRQHINFGWNAVIRLQGSEESVTIGTFKRTIAVHVIDAPWYRRVWIYVSDNWHWLWTAILVPVGGWLLRRWKKKNRIIGFAAGK